MTACSELRRKHYNWMVEALNHDHYPGVVWLLQSGVDVNHVPVHVIRGRPLLCSAVETGKLYMAELLLRYGASTSSNTADTDDPLYLAAHCSEEMMLLLMWHGVQACVEFERFYAERLLLRIRPVQTNKIIALLSVAQPSNRGLPGIMVPHTSMFSLIEEVIAESTTPAFVQHAALWAIRMRATDIVIALEELNLPAWCTTLIIRELPFGRAANLAKLWQIATTAKHRKF